MKKHTPRWVQAVGAMVSVFLMGNAAAEQILLHQEAIHPDNVKASFGVNLNRKIAAVNIAVDRTGGAQMTPIPPFEKLHKDLVYDPTTNEVKFKDVVCAKVKHRLFLFTRWQSVDETGNCKFVKKYTRVPAEKSFDRSRPYSVTEVYLQTRNGDS